MPTTTDRCTCITHWEGPGPERDPACPVHGMGATVALQLALDREAETPSDGGSE